LLLRTVLRAGTQVNTRQQTTQRQAGAAKSQGSGWNTALEMIKEDGSRALFRGWGAAMFGTGVSQVRAIVFPHSAPRLALSSKGQGSKDREPLS
jgi:hypothetical protein